MARRAARKSKCRHGPGWRRCDLREFLDAVKKVYTEHGFCRIGDSDDDANCLGFRDIAKDGSVVSPKCSAFRKSSIDRSVQMTLDRVRIVVPLPGRCEG
jgi:hypothetical protein